VYQATLKKQDQLDLFRNRLPKHPYCTDELEAGISILHARKALKSRYIQPNGPTHKFWLVFDIDRPGAVLDWRDRNAPPPNIAVINPNNHHGHLIYGLEIPVRTAPDGRIDPLRYAGAIEAALCDVLEADLSYAGLICKNPLHGYWDAHVFEDLLYSLNDLEGWLDLSTYSDRRKNLPAYGLGRNCNLFNYLRQWAYKAIRQGWPAYDRWFEAVLTRAEGYNIQQFGEAPAGPLPYSEVKATAKSVARWVHRNMSQASFDDYVNRTHAPEIQAARGAKGGKVSKGGGRPSRKDELLPRVLEMRSQGYNLRAIEDDLGVSRSTLSEWLR